MTKEKIHRLKRDGAYCKLADTIRHLLWDARKLTEKAEGEGMKEFVLNINQAKANIADAEQLYKEMVAI